MSRRKLHYKRMFSYTEISSKNNENLRTAILLRAMHGNTKKVREAGEICIEGVRLCEDVLSSGFAPRQLFFTKEKIALIQMWIERFSISDMCRFFLLPEHLFTQLAGTKTPQGVAAIVHLPGMPEKIPLHGSDIFLICEDVSDPGNMGTMIRMADAFSFSAVLYTKNTVSPYNEKVIRASMGSCFHIPLIEFETIGAICEALGEYNIHMIGTHLQGNSLDGTEFSFPAAFVIGNEARGLSDTCAAFCRQLLKIPMEGKAESLNAAAAAAIIGYEISKQRRINQNRMD